MRAIQIERFGGPEVLRLADIPVPEPGEGEVLVKMAYAGVNFTDIYRRSGQYAESPTYPTPLPYVLGVEGAGTVAEVGPDVTDYTPGDRVAFTRNPGSYAEYAIAPKHRLVRLPDALGLDVAAAIMTHGTTAHYLAHDFGLACGGSCLVHAGAGGVGQMLTQMAKLQGVTVIATVGSAEKEDVAYGCGADHVVRYREVNFKHAVRELTQGRGVDVVYDSVGRDTLLDSLYCLRRKGVCVLYGNASGRVDSFNTMHLAEAGSVFLTRPHLAHYIATPEDYARRTGQVVRWALEGKLKVRIQQIYDLSQVAQAHEVLSNRATRGKLIVKIGTR